MIILAHIHSGNGVTLRQAFVDALACLGATCVCHALVSIFAKARRPHNQSVHVRNLWLRLLQVAIGLLILLGGFLVAGDEEKFGFWEWIILVIFTCVVGVIRYVAGRRKKGAATR